MEAWLLENSAPPKESPKPFIEYDPLWWKKFQYDQYDWDDPEFKRKNRGKFAYRPIRLTQGYFMMVSPSDFKKMTQYPDGKQKKFYVDIKKRLEEDEPAEIVKVYASRRGRGGEPASTYAHREITHSLFASREIDHVNGWGLDNRKPNLSDDKANRHNSVRNRRVHLGLPVGVEKKKNGKYGGIRCVRLGPRRVKVIRTKRTWLTPGPAARWYLNQLKKLHRREAWAHEPKTVNFPLFPPRWEEEPKTLRRKNKRNGAAHNVPF